MRQVGLKASTVNRGGWRASESSFSGWMVEVKLDDEVVGVTSRQTVIDKLEKIVESEHGKNHWSFRKLDASKHRGQEARLGTEGDILTSEKGMPCFMSAAGILR